MVMALGGVWCRVRRAVGIRVLVNDVQINIIGSVHVCLAEVVNTRLDAGVACILASPSAVHILHHLPVPTLETVTLSRDTGTLGVEDHVLLLPNVRYVGV